MKEKRTIAARNLKSFILAAGWVATHRRQEGILEHTKTQETGYLMSYAKFKDAFFEEKPRDEGNFHERQK